RVGSNALETTPANYGMTSLQQDVFQGGGLNIATASLTASIDGDRFIFRSASSSSTSSPQSPEESGLTSWSESSAEFSQPFTTVVSRRVTLSGRVDRSADQPQVRAAISVESQGGLKSLNLSDTAGQTEVVSILFPPGQHLIQAEISTSSSSNAAGPQTGRLSGEFSIGADSDHGFVLVTAEADLDADSLVGSSDLSLWSAGFGMSQGAGFADGDVNEDREVNGADFLIWQRQFGPVASISAAAQPVPEPSGWGLLLVGATAAIGRRARRLSR
ncbi:MAG: PEP-CTERM sorting domain-containing protein, partial [Planctomycetota bacterium]